MTAYITRRIIQTLIVVALLSYFCYVLMSLMPGDPVDMMISSNPKITSADVERLRALYGLDQPIYVRYGNWVKSIFAGDLGYSRTYRIPVSSLIGEKLMNTMYLSLASLVLSLLISIPLGVWSAIKSGKKADYIINFFSFTGISLPSFWLGLMLIIIFAVKLQILPASGTYTIGLEDASFFEQFADRLTYLILPTLSLSYMQIGRYVRFTRSSMVEVLRQDYIRTAKSKGLTYKIIMMRHAFRNTLIPLITILALSFSGLFSGALITETVFSYQGVGKLFYDSIVANDFNVAMVSFMISIIMVLAMNLLADILYGVADPRIAYN